MIFGVGVDLVKIPRVKEVIAQWGDRFKNRVFSQGEITYCERSVRSEERYASHFAVKEAFLKALGTGWGRSIGIRDIEVTRNQAGKPSVLLHRKAKKMADEIGITNVHTSISHDGEYAVAVVVLEM